MTADIKRLGPPTNSPLLTFLTVTAVSDISISSSRYRYRKYLKVSKGIGCIDRSSLVSFVHLT